MRLMVVDMNALLTRAYYVKMEWYWFTMLLNRAKLYDPTHIIFCFDEPTPPEANVRKVINSGYKANRKPDPKRYEFIEATKQLVKEFYPDYVYCHYEADDTIASIAYSYSQSGWEVGIVTGDKDLFQCASLPNTVIIYLPDKVDFIYNKAKVTDKYMPPEEIATYKALAGDVGDNIKGGKKIGDKTARALTTTYKTLENIYYYISEIDNKVANKLIVSQEQILESYQLAKLRFVSGTYMAKQYDPYDIIQMRDKYFSQLAVETMDKIDWSLI